MTHLYNRLLVAITLMVMLALGLVAAVSAASAATGPWQWADISENLGARENRPVWASAYAHPYWYLTDGQELYTGGHVWKTDGAVMEDITAEVRNAGLNRVDDIVTDGHTIMFLKNVVSANKNFEALTYKDGTWGYPAYTWQSNMASNEAISSINGKDGIWMIVSTQGKLYRWTQSTNNFVSIALPSDIRNNLLNTTIYQTNHGKTPGGVSIVPVKNRWLVLLQTNELTNTPGSNQIRFYVLNDRNFTEIKRIHGTYLYKLVSNGSQALILTDGSYRMNYKQIFSYENSAVTEVFYYTPYNNQQQKWDDLKFNNALVGNNGKSWMIVSDKNLYRLDNGNVDYYGETRDYFTTISGNGNGTFMLGGAVSQMGNPNPTSPLTAKLVRVDEGTGYNPPTTPVVNTQNNVWASISVSHNKHELYHSQSSNINITGGSPNGINRIELWLNGNIVKTCQSTSCSHTIYGSNYTKGSALAFNGRVIDNQGHEAWTWLGEYYVPVDNYNNNNNYYNSNDRLSVWFDFEPSGTSMYGDDYKTIKAHANAEDGLKKLEIYVNDNLKRSCSFNTVYGEQNCYYTVYNNQYSSYDKLKVYAKAYDNYGRQIQTNAQYIYRNGYYDYDYDYDNGRYDSSVAAWFDGSVSKSTLGRNESRNIKFYGNANRGLDKLELFANGNIIGTCNYSAAYGNQACTKTIYGNTFNAGQSVTLKVRATDRDGYQNWSGSVSFNVEEGGTNTGGDDVYAWIWYSPSDSNLEYNESKTIKASASADDGLQKIEIYANGNLIKTCNYSRVYGNQNCEVTIYGSNYNANSTINIYARATDYYGRTDITGTQYIYRNSTGDNNNSNNVYAWMWLNPSDGTLSRNETLNVNIGAAADDGLQKIEIYANGNLKKTCSFNRSYGNQECQADIYGGDYASGRNISIYARAYDYNGRSTQTESKNVFIDYYDNNNNQNNTQGNLTITSNRDSGYSSSDQITFTANGSDANGINKIEILVNARIVKTCNNTGYCGFTGGPYTTETVSYGANLYDDLGNRTWTGYKTINKR